MSNSPLDTPSSVPRLEGSERLRAWWHLMAVDHGFLRLFYLNRHKVSDELWRSAQPSPRDLERVAAAGFKSVLNLRGAEQNNYRYRLEREACERLGLTLVSLPARSRRPLKTEVLLDAITVWDRLEPPILMHCKSGADRAGLMSTLYLHVVKNVPIREAMKQLSLKYGHLRHGRTGIVYHVFDQFARRQEETGISFRKWAETEYDPDALAAGFRPKWLHTLIVDKILRRE